MGMTLAQLAAEKQNEYKDEIILANVNGKLKELGEEYIRRNNLCSHSGHTH